MVVLLEGSRTGFGGDRLSPPAAFPTQCRKLSRQPTRASAMTVSMYKISVPIFVQFLTALGAVLGKAAAHCEAKKIDPSALLNARLFPDMFPLARQVRAATDHAVNATARLAGAEPLAFANADPSFSELRERLDKAIG